MKSESKFARIVRAYAGNVTMYGAAVDLVVLALFAYLWTRADSLWGMTACVLLGGLTFVDLVFTMYCVLQRKSRPY